MLPTAIRGLKHRNELGPVLDTLGLNGHAVEVGVNLGRFSDTLLRTSRLHHLFSVDIWERNGPELSQLNYLQCAARLAMHRTRSSLIRMPSTTAAKLFTNQSLDLVFIDADHRYESVKMDMHAWYRKIKPGGILAGHDYWLDRPDDCQWNNVKKAVDEFIRHHRLELHYSLDDPKINNCSWYTVKRGHEQCEENKRIDKLLAEAKRKADE